ncbi:MAG: type II toxin-antitoxin system MqsA family antitoxin [Alphaproteobacteria bacterium]|nr:type II toxin-antitoxin system MqsA family antitoxin [Alphaproteobacteria bacterium]
MKKLKPNQRLSPLTGQVLTRGVRKVKITFEGQSETVALPGWYPRGGSSEDGLHAGKDMDVSDAALSRLKAKALGALTPSEVRAVRAKLKLSQREAGKLLGGGPRAFQKYESGEITASGPMSRLLRLLATDPKRLKELQD